MSKSIIVFFHIFFKIAMWLMYLFSSYYSIFIWPSPLARIILISLETFSFVGVCISYSKYSITGMGTNCIPDDNSQNVLLSVWWMASLFFFWISNLITTVFFYLKEVKIFSNMMYLVLFKIPAIAYFSYIFKLQRS